MLIKKYNWELLYRLFYICFGTIFSFLSVFIYSQEYYYLIIKPYLNYMNNGNLIYTNLFEIIFSYIKLSIIISLVVLFLLIFFNLYYFLKNSLYTYQVKKIRNYILSFIIITYIYWRMFKYILILLFIYLESYLVELNSTSIQINFEPKVNEYLSVYIKISLLLYIIFCIPYIILILKDLNILNLEVLLKWRIIFYIVTIIIIISIMPPDLLIHVSIFSIIFIIYEIILFINSIYYKYWVKQDVV